MSKPFVSPALLRPLRTEEEARADLRKKCQRCGGTGYIAGQCGALGVWPLCCPICNKEGS